MCFTNNAVAVTFIRALDNIRVTFRLIPDKCKNAAKHEALIGFLTFLT